MYDERVGLDLAQVVEVRREVVGALAHRLDRGDAEPAPPALLAEEPEVLLAVRRDLAQHRDPLVIRGASASPTTSAASPPQSPLPSRKQYSPCSRSVPHQLISGTCELVRERADGDRVVGAVRAGDADAALVDQVPEPVGRVLRRALRQPVLGVQHELDRPIEQPLLRRLVEGQPVDLVVAAAGPVERRPRATRS